MINSFLLDSTEQNEVMRINKLYEDRLESNDFEMVKSCLRQLKSHERTYQLPSLFHKLKSYYFDLGVIERYKNRNFSNSKFCFSMCARFGYLMELSGGKNYSGGYDCLHVYSMLVASSCDDHFTINRFLDVFPGPSKSGHLSSVILCNRFYDALKSKSCLELSPKQKKHKLTKYYAAMTNAIIAIINGNRQHFLAALIEVLKHQRRQQHLMYLEKIFCINAHGLYRTWVRMHNVEISEISNDSLWDWEFNDSFLPHAHLINIKFEKDFPVLAKWLTHLPGVLVKEEFVASLR